MKSRAGLTIIELFVVLAIISLLLGLLLPAVQSARERARETVCKNNLYQLNLALAQFAEVRKKLPAPNPLDRVGGWTIEVLPFIEQGNLNNSITKGLAITDVSQSLYKPPAILRCPRRTILDSTSDNVLWPSHYVFIPTSRRDSFLLYDAPRKMNTPWLAGPEFEQSKISQEQGPHHDGFFFVAGFQQGVSFMLNGEVFR